MEHSTLDIFKCYLFLWCSIQLAAVFDRWNTRPMTFSDAIHCVDERESFFLFLQFLRRTSRCVHYTVSDVTVTINTTMVVLIVIM